MAGVPIIQVQQWMGHSTINMTMRYAHLAPGVGADWIKALEGPANGSATVAKRAEGRIYGTLTALSRSRIIKYL
jgi:hypothetical protein